MAEAETLLNGPIFRDFGWSVEKFMGAKYKTCKAAVESLGSSSHLRTTDSEAAYACDGVVCYCVQAANPSLQQNGPDGKAHRQ